MCRDPVADLRFDKGVKYACVPTSVESQVVRSVQLPKLGSTKRGASMQFP